MSSYSTPRLSSVPTCVGNCVAARSYKLAGVARRCRGGRFPGPGRTGRRRGCRRPRRPARTARRLRRIAAQGRDRGRRVDTDTRPSARPRRTSASSTSSASCGVGRCSACASALASATSSRVVAGLLGRLVGRERLGVLVEGEVGLAQVEVGQRAAVAVRERVDGVAVAAEQVLADAQPGRRRRAAVRLRLRARRPRRAGRGSWRSLSAMAAVICSISRGPNGRCGNDNLFQVGFEADDIIAKLLSSAKLVSCQPLSDQPEAVRLTAHG